MSYYDDEEDFCVGCDCSHFDECCDIAYESALQDALKPYGVDTLEELIKSIKDKTIDEVSRAMYHQCFECDNDEVCKERKYYEQGQADERSKVISMLEKQCEKMNILEFSDYKVKGILMGIIEELKRGGENGV